MPLSRQSVDRGLMLRESTNTHYLRADFDKDAAGASDVSASAGTA